MKESRAKDSVPVPARDSSFERGGERVGLLADALPKLKSTKSIFMGMPLGEAKK